MTDHPNPDNDGGANARLAATCRVALAGLLHDLGKLAERAGMVVQIRRRSISTSSSTAPIRGRIRAIREGSRMYTPHTPPWRSMPSRPTFP